MLLGEITVKQCSVLMLESYTIRANAGSNCGVGWSSSRCLGPRLREASPTLVSAQVPGELYLACLARAGYLEARLLGWHEV